MADHGDQRRGALGGGERLGIVGLAERDEPPAEPGERGGLGFRLPLGRDPGRAGRAAAAAERGQRVQRGGRAAEMVEKAAKRARADVFGPDQPQPCQPLRIRQADRGTGRDGGGPGQADPSAGGAVFAPMRLSVPASSRRILSRCFT